MSSRHSTLPNQTQVSESWTRKELHVHNAEVPLGRHIQPESAHKTRQEVRYHSPVNHHPSTTHCSQEKEWRPTSSHLAPPSKTQTPVPRSTPPGAASRNGEPQNKAYDSRANHILPTFRYSLEPERRTAPSHLAPPSKPRSPVPHSSPIPCGPSQNSERATNNYRSASIPSSSEESYSSVGSGDTSHSEYMQGSDSDSCADSDNNLVDSSESAGNESDVSVVSRGTRRDEVLHAAAQLQADAELRAAALQAEYDDADEELGRIRTSIARYKLKAEAVIISCERNCWGKANSCRVMRTLSPLFSAGTKSSSRETSCPFCNTGTILNTG